MQKLKTQSEIKNWIKNFIIFLVSMVVLIIIIKFVYYNVDFLNKNSGAIQIVVAVLLCIITAIYAFFTYRMTSIMKEQIISDIQISNVVVGTYFMESWFLERLKNTPEQIKNDSYLKFKLLFDVYNKSSGNGSIEKPILILKFNNDNFEYEILPITKEKHTEKVEERGGMTLYDETITDFGGAIFLRGGDFQKIELEYTLYDFTEELLNHIKQHLNFLEYFIRFSDNLNNSYLLKIQKIQPEKETYRR